VAGLDDRQLRLRSALVVCDKQEMAEVNDLQALFVDVDQRKPQGFSGATVAKITRALKSAVPAVVCE
jgi:hypothetical protein